MYIYIYYILARTGSNILFIPYKYRGTVVAQWLGCCATNRKVAGLIPAGVSGFFIDKISLLSHYDLGVDSVFNLLAPELFFKILAHPVYKM